MSKYRIVSNGEEYRILIKISLFFIPFWFYLKRSVSMPGGFASLIVNFKTLEEAEIKVKELVTKKKKREWKIVKEYEDGK